MSRAAEPYGQGTDPFLERRGPDLPEVAVQPLGLDDVVLAVRRLAGVLELGNAAVPGLPVDLQVDVTVDRCQLDLVAAREVELEHVDPACGDRPHVPLPATRDDTVRRLHVL